MRTNIKGFIAKVLVLCMIVGLLPTVALAAGATTNKPNSGTYYEISVDATTNGKVTATYTIGEDSTAYTICSDATTQQTYYIGKDTKSGAVKVKVTLTPDSGYEIDSSTSYYQIGSAGQVTISSADTTITIPNDAASGTVLKIHAAFKVKSSTTPSGGSGGGGGGSSATVNTSSAKNGSFTVSDRNAKAGDTVTVTPKPDKGFVVDNVVVKDKNGDSVTVTKNADGTFSFEMPDEKLLPVTVDVNFREETVTDIYTDVPANAWYATAVKYCYDNGLMTGVGDNKFAPGATTTRGQVVTVLWNIEGRPSVSGNGGFDDVPSGSMYATAIAWAKASGIVSGYSDTKFGPDDNMNRQQLAVVMCRYAAYKGYNTELGADLSGYTDAGQISSWAEDAMEWANREGLIGGTSATTLAPAAFSTRGQLAQIFMNYCEKIVK